jgi:WD40 repeat protein
MHFVGQQGVQDIPGHAARNFLLRSSSDHDRFAAFGAQDKIEIWDGGTHSLLYTIDTQHSDVSQLKFVNSDTVIYANSAGSIVRWQAPAQLTELARFKQPVASFVVLQPDGLVVELSDGSLRQVTTGQPPSVIPQSHAREHLLALSKDHRWLATGNEHGEVVVYDTRSWRAAVNFHDSGAVQHVAISPTNDVIAIAMTSGALHLGRTSSGSSEWADLAWHHFSAHPRFVTFSPTGDLAMATTSEGVIWFYAPASDRWLSLASGIAGLTVLVTSRDGQRAATVDSIGRLTTIDLSFVRSLLADSSARNRK